jgi:hypothetical protein
MCSSSPNNGRSAAGVFLRAILPLVVIAIGTPLALWGTAEFLEPRNFRRSPPAQTVFDEPLSVDQFHPIEVAPQMPVVSGFHVLAAQQAQGRVADEELVLAVVLNGQPRAWPLNIMTGPEREVFNDTLGGRAIAATW